MLPLVLCSLFFPYVFGGSPCLPREKIYPCICIDRSIGKSKFDTTVICHGLANGDSLSAIESNLASMVINKFLLYDSYWQAIDTGRLQADARIPVNHISSFPMEDVEVVDTMLSAFGCPATDNCKTSYLKKFTAINSSVSERSSCNNNGVTINSWISCPSSVQQVTINKGFTTDTSLRPEFFPEAMSKLKSLRMPNNNIIRVDRKTFTSVKFPVLHTLDLSYNSLRDMKSTFSSSLKLHHLDLSHNSIRTIVDFQQLTHLHTLKLNDNHIINLLEFEWQYAPSSLRHIDLSNNKIQCNCAMQWINSTFHMNADLLGSCSSPADIASKTIRKASRYFIERCDADGNIGPKKSKKSKQN